MSATGSAARMGSNMSNYPGRKALEAGLGPLLGPGANKLAGTHVQRLLGYWVMWRVFGGRDALIGQGFMSMSSAYKAEREFKRAFGIDVSELALTRVFGPNPPDLPGDLVQELDDLPG